MTDKKKKDVPQSTSETEETTESSQEAALEVLKADLAQVKEDHLRALAEIDNLHKRHRREQEEARKYGVTNLLRELLTVVDNLERALGSVTPDKVDEAFIKTITEGVGFVHQDVIALLERQGVTVLNPEGERFDPHHHQAISEVDHKTVLPGHVVEVFQKGYTIHDRLLRPAMVTLAKSPTDQTGGPSEETDESKS